VGEQSGQKGNINFARNGLLALGTKDRLGLFFFVYGIIHGFAEWTLGKVYLPAQTCCASTRPFSPKDSPMITTTTGLQYEDTADGSGTVATKGQSVTVHYTGWIYNNGTQGAKFDSSKDRNDPFVFQLGAGMVIRGWDEGVAGMKVGGARTLIIPADLGYGARGAGGVIPPNATLKFDVELLGTSS
jgi:FKBP-type peptidyl-prolyl cis-trans isomerase FkpA